MQIERLNPPRLSMDLRAAACGDLSRLLRQLTGRPYKISADQLDEVCTKSCVFVMRSDDTTILGLAVLVPSISFDHRSGYVHSVVVSEEWRGRKIGHRLMDAILQEAQGLGLEFLELTSRPSREAANRFYQSLGYERRETNVYRLKLSA